MNAGKKEQQLESLELMVRCEEAVVGYYQACAEAWPAERVFWGDLGTEELARMTRLQLMQSRAKASEKAAKSIRTYPVPALRTFLAWVKSSRDRVKSGEVSPRRALAIARDLERSPIVNDHYQVARWADPDLANYLLSFATEYGEHTRRIEERLDRSLTTARVA